MSEDRSSDTTKRLRSLEGLSEPLDTSVRALAKKHGIPLDSVKDQGLLDDRPYLEDLMPERVK